MSLEIPQGGAAPEQAPTTADQKGEKSSGRIVSCKLWIVPILLVLVAAGVLIGALPDWDMNSDHEASTQEKQSRQLEDSSTTLEYLESSKGPFDVKLPLFSSKITEGYSNDEDLKHDLNQAAGFLLNDVILTNRDAGIYVGGNVTGNAPPRGNVTGSFPPHGNETGSFPPGGNVTGSVPPMAPPAGGKGQADSMMGGGAESGAFSDQEFTIDRADFVKSDGNLVFASYSDYLVVWSANGPEIITKIKMPALNVTGYNPGPMDPRPMDGGEANSTDGSSGVDVARPMQPGPMQFGPMQPGPMRFGPMQPGPMQFGSVQFGPMQPRPMDGGEANSTGGSSGADVARPMQPRPMQPRPMDGGEGNATHGSSSDMMASDKMILSNPKPRIEALLIHENRLTVVISGYGMENAQKLGYVPILHEYQGTRVQLYDINNGALSLVSQTDINGGFCNAYAVDQNVYIVTQSGVNTREHLVAPLERWQPQFAGLDDADYVQNATALVDEGLVDAFIERLLSELRVNGAIDLARLSVFTDSISQENLDQSLYTSSIANAVTQVFSFDMSQTITPQITGTFHPGSWAQVYAMGSMIVVADQSWSWVEADGQAAQKTYLVCFRLNGPSSSPAMVGSVDGYVMNPFSLDYVEKSGGSYVRIATTQSFLTPWVGTLEEGTVGDDSETVTEAKPSEPGASNTLNHIIVLRVPISADASGDLVLEQVGSLELGEPNEMFTAVRFFDNFAYAVTFEQTDPFYVVDLTSEQPVKVGELKVTGFSQYLHPIDSNDQYLVSLGQESDTDGNILGLQVSLFDATTPSNPVLVNRLLVEQDKNTYSDSSASWDERAFRYVSLGDRTGKVIIPFSMYSWQEFNATTGEPLAMPLSESFEGFSVFNIANGVITKDFDIDHSFEAPQPTNCSFWYDWLPERSFVFNGKLMTMKKFTIISTDLATGETLWTNFVNDTIPVECM